MIRFFVIASIFFAFKTIAQQDTLTWRTYSFPLVQELDTQYIKKYPVVDFTKNHFQFYNDTNTNWQHLAEQLDSLILLKDRKLNFYHIGGSHLQADIYTHDVRTKLQSHWDSIPGERGFVFPFDLAKTNNPANYEFSSPNTWKAYRSVSSTSCELDYGLLGAIVSSKDSIIQVAYKYDKTTVKPPISHIRIFHNQFHFPFSIQLFPEGLIAEQQTDTLQGITDLYLLQEIDSFNLQFIRLVDSIIPLHISAIELMNNQPGISYTAIGINGAGLYSYLSCGNFENQLRVAPPDFFAFSVGTNDGNVPYEAFSPEKYQSNLEKMIQIVLRANPNCAILLTVPNDAYYQRKYPNRNMAREREVIIELAKTYQCAVWDMYGIMGEFGASKKWQLAGLMQADKVHFTVPGYHLKGDLYFDAFLKWMVQMKSISK